MSSIAIIGGGFSGTMVAVHLLRLDARPESRVILINRSGMMARGVAYGTQSTHHVLNVPAGSMSAFEDDPDDFVRFVQRDVASASRDSFVCRRYYGAYLEALLERASEHAPGRLLRLNTEVVRIDAPAGEGQAQVVLSNGSTISVDRVVLAVGNYPPVPPLLADERFFHTSRRYVNDPWRAGALDRLAHDAPVLLIGTGLTMIDIVLELRALGMTGHCIAVSRRGLLPHSHAPRNQPGDRQKESALAFAGPATVRSYIRSIRSHARAGAERGADWRDTMALLRPITARLWHALPMDERRRFMRHLRPFWDAHRHRLAPQLRETFTLLQRTGGVRVQAGRIQSLREDANGVRVRVQPRGSSQTLQWHVGAVINCTGPANDTRRLRDTLFQAMQREGLLVPDPLGLGVHTSPTGALMGADGRTSTTVFYVGPFLRARDWEATAVPELRQYATRLAEHLVQPRESASISSICALDAVDATTRW